MKNRNTFRKIAVICLSVAFTLSAAACGEGLITTNSEKDMAQVIGTVNIAGHDDFKSNGQYAEYADVIGSINQNILKRDLVAYFLNAGSTYISSYGYTYEKTFNTLMDNLTSRKIMVQYAMAYYFDKHPDTYSVSGYNAYIESERGKVTDETEKKLYAAHPEIFTLKYFLTEGGKTSAEDTADYDRAVYGLKKMINNSLDSAEKTYLKEEEDDEDDPSAESRTTPTGVGTETEDYYDTDYEVYTGRNAASACGSYKRLDGSTQKTRQRAYNDFLANLSRNGLLGDEDTTDFTKVDYYFVELASQMEQALITKYTDDLGEEANAKLTEAYVTDQYNALLESQKNIYSADQSAFETQIGNVSDDSFVVYSPKEGFGFVYNILLPFSKTQTQLLSTYTNDKGLEKREFYQKRAELLENVQGKDLRAAWFSKDEDSNYAYEAEAGDYYGNASNYLFFENNLTKSDGDNARYEKLGQYYGEYAYNGAVTKDEDGKYTCKPNEITIDGFLGEMEGYLKYAGLTASGSKKSTYVTDADKYTVDNKGKFDYSQFVYYEGKVTLNDTATSDYFVKGKDAYTAVSVINELTFAYSTDTGLFNKYMGYTVSPYKTSYMAEFEYAAQYAIKEGVGTYVVCPTDYGWHVIYVSFVYDKVGEVYNFDWEQIDEEGSFSNLYYESLKSSNADTYTNLIQTQILGEYKKDECVTLHKNRYKDLLSLDKN